MKYASLTGLALLTATTTHALEGRVVDSYGRPVTEAIIKPASTRAPIAVDDQGEFNLEVDNIYEIHIIAPGYSHAILDLKGVNRDVPQIIALERSVIEQIDVVGIPVHASNIESAQPISVLSGEQLRNRQTATLGDSLIGEMGVHSSFHGGVASTPIIRGLSGPRVMITQNSLDVGDASRIGPDHAVASEVATAEQVEVLRGPATLFYGSGAIGGVVNIVDRRIPQSANAEGQWYLSHQTVNAQNMGAFDFNGGVKNVGFHLDGFWRASDDYKVPTAPVQGRWSEDTEPGTKTVAHSSDASRGVTVGGSYLTDNGYLGVSIGHLDRRYGIPGHSHAEPLHEPQDAGVFAKLNQNRLQIASELSLASDWLNAINTRIGYTDYTHTETDAGELGTVFANTTSEFKLDLLHRPIMAWKGGWTMHYKHSAFDAAGAEAFTPPSTSQTLALALVEERHLGALLFQLGARVERVTLNADQVRLPLLSMHNHEQHPSDAHEHEHEHDHQEPTITRVLSAREGFTPVSASLGIVWDFRPGYNIALAYGHAERAPSASELLAFGPHMGNRSYEVGGLFQLHEEEGEAGFEINSAPLKLETSNNLDLTFRKHQGDLGLILNLFYNRVRNYYYQTASGYYVENTHEHEINHEGAPEQELTHASDLPVYFITRGDAELYGFEAQGIWQVTPQLTSSLFTDYVHAELKETGAYLPRTPPLRYGARLTYQWHKVTAELSWSHYQDQTKTAEFETPSNGYDWINAVVTWQLPVSAHELALFAKVDNITDSEARVHTSFLKDIAPRPGRSFTIGLRGAF